MKNQHYAPVDAPAPKPQPCEHCSDPTQDWERDVSPGGKRGPKAYVCAFCQTAERDGLCYGWHKMEGDTVCYTG